MMKFESPKVLTDAIISAPFEAVDAMWAVLKYPQIGIKRKIMSICHILNVPYGKIESLLPNDGHGRILDHDTRHMVHDFLIQNKSSNKS